MNKYFSYALPLAAFASASIGFAQPAMPTPPMQRVLDTLASLGGKPIETLSAKEARKQPSPADAVKKIMKEDKIKAEKVYDISNKSIEGPAGKIKIRIYTPSGTGPFPVIVYYHGGGFVIADLDTYDATPRILANAVNAVVVSAHYRQGPEDKFPASHDDALAAYKWVAAHTSDLKGNGKIALVGESAGGNLASYVGLEAAKENLTRPVYQVLVYPVTNTDMTDASYVANANAKPLSAAMMKWFFANESKPGDENDPRLVPMKADVSAAPPTTLITDQIDPLQTEGQLFSEKLKKAGVAVVYRNYDGVTHEFFGMGAVVPTAKQAEDEAAADLRRAFGN